MRLVKVVIQRYRSIVDKLELDIENANIATIIGENNVGKTNILRAINLFFNPETYDEKNDIPELKQAQRSQSRHPQIILTFLDDKTRNYTEITTNFKYEEDDLNFEKGIKYTGSLKRKKENKNLSNNDIKDFLNRCDFIFVEAINVDTGKLITESAENVLENQSKKTTFQGKRGELKEAYNAYKKGLQDVLNDFSKELSSDFRAFNKNWSINLEVGKNIKSFSDLLTDIVELSVVDGGVKTHYNKGSGLQRLAYIILKLKLQSKVNAETKIICIDEPDSFLHEGLQKILFSYLNEFAKSQNIIITTHSKAFIPAQEHNIKSDVKLIKSSIEKKYVERKKSNVTVVRTEIDESANSISKICEHLGIEILRDELLQDVNIIVEGESDKIYLEKLLDIFNKPKINIISENGADNIPKSLKWYNSVYDKTKQKPKILVILDNDSKGRGVYSIIDGGKFKNLTVSKRFIPSSHNTIPNEKCNLEIEDFILPEIVINLCNKILEKASMEPLDVECAENFKYNQSLKDKGILEYIEFKKNAVNPKDGSKITFNSSNSEHFKKSLASLFKNITKDQENDITSNNVIKNFIEEIADFGKCIN